MKFFAGPGLGTPVAHGEPGRRPGLAPTWSATLSFDASEDGTVRKRSIWALPVPLATRAKLVLFALILLALAAAWSPTPAAAAAPVATEPRSRQQLGDQPGAVTLAFDRVVDPGVAKMIVTGPDGSNVTAGPLIVEGTNVTSQLREDLPRGTYTVHYRIDGRGGQPEGGAFQFSYGKGDFRTPTDRSWSGSKNEPKVLSGTNPNSSDNADPSGPPATPGIEVTSRTGSTDPQPPATEPPPVPSPTGPTTDQPSATSSDRTGTGGASSEPTTTTTPSTTAGSGATPFVVGAVLVLAALVGGAVGIWQVRKRRGPHE